MYCNRLAWSVMGGWGSHHGFCDKHSGSSPTHVPNTPPRKPIFRDLYFDVISVNRFKLLTSIVSFSVSRVMLNVMCLLQLNQARQMWPCRAAFWERFSLFADIHLKNDL